MVVKAFFALLGIAALALIAYAVTMVVVLFHTAQVLSGPPQRVPAQTAPVAPPPPPQHAAVAPDINVLDAPSGYRGVVIVHYGLRKAAAPKHAPNRVVAGGYGLAWTPDSYSVRRVSLISVLGSELLKAEPVLVRNITADEVIEVFVLGLTESIEATQERAGRTLDRYIAEGCPVTFYQAPVE